MVLNEFVSQAIIEGIAEQFSWLTIEILMQTQKYQEPIPWQRKKQLSPSATQHACANNSSAATKSPKEIEIKPCTKLNRAVHIFHDVLRSLEQSSNFRGKMVESSCRPYLDSINFRQIQPIWELVPSSKQYLYSLLKLTKSSSAAYARQSSKCAKKRWLLWSEA